ncbi:hypothetical protein OF001_U80013 [Pseudomonas sp. OF001]|nr:hypothetical protein OF001_U80013 [Pseudomonas sp. OF001]
MWHNAECRIGLVVPFVIQCRTFQPQPFTCLCFGRDQSKRPSRASRSHTPPSQPGIASDAGAGINKRPFFDTEKIRPEKVSTNTGLQVVDTNAQ